MYIQPITFGLRDQACKVYSSLDKDRFVCNFGSSIQPHVTCRRKEFGQSACVRVFVVFGKFSNDYIDVLYVVSSR
jgi:hypothetical protein